MRELPDYLKAGEEARLIPVGAGTQRERFACSVLLASLRVVQPFARTFFGHMDMKIGSWAQIQGYTEPVFRNQPNGTACRPDGLVIVNTGKRERRYLVETKIGSAKIDSDQLLQYFRLARANKLDAIITVSNELSADPSHLPYELPREAKKVPIYHWSWAYLVMLAELLLREEEDFDEEQDYILREIIRYFDHESAGISFNTQMGADWSNVVDRIQEGARLTLSDPCVANAVQGWHQQLVSACISQTRRLKVPVSLRLSKSHWDQGIRLSEDISGLLATNKVSAIFDFGADLPVEITADAGRRNLTCRLSVDAPLNRQRYRARLRWLLNQLPEDMALPVRIELVWDRGRRSDAGLSSLREDLNAARIDSPGAPRSFDIVYVADLAGKFAGPRNFVVGFEETLSTFYESVARHIRPWQRRLDAGLDDAAEGQADLDEGPGSNEPKRTVTQSGSMHGRAFAIFDDGSIEVETGNGLQRFSNFAELNAAASKNGHAGLD